MRFSDATNTLAYHLQARPLTNKIPFEGMPCAALGNRAKAFLESNGQAMAETEALWFYLGEHALAALRRKRALHEPLSEPELKLVEDVYRRSNQIFLRMLYYVTVICVREARHVNSQADQIADKAKKAGTPFSLAAVKFAKSIHDDSSVAMQQFIDHAPEDLTMGELSKVLSFIFYKGHWPSSGYGGPKWGNVSDALVNLVHGVYSPQMFVDVGCALAHNGGPIWNKGMFYKGYNNAELQKILDVQRAGMIPRLVMTDASKVVSHDMKMFTIKNDQVFGDDAVGEIDWTAVQKAGAVGNYKSMIKSKQEKEEAAKQAALLKHVTAKVQVWHDEVVTVMTREGMNLATAKNEKKKAA